MKLRPFLTHLWLKTRFCLQARGLEHLTPPGNDGLLIAANHHHPRDFLLLAAHLPETTLVYLPPERLPGRLTQRWLNWIRFAPMDPADTKMGVETLADHLKKGGVALVFPEGRPGGVGGSLGKIYPISALAADRAGVAVTGVHIAGSEDPPRWRLPRPPRHLTAIAPQKMALTPESENHSRVAACRTMESRLGLALVANLGGRETLWQALCRTARRFGRHKTILEDATGTQASYGLLLTGSLVLGRAMAQQTEQGERVGLMLPASVGAVVAFFALHAFGRVPVVLNFTTGPGPLLSACKTARIRTVFTSQMFIRKAGLEALARALGDRVELVHLETLRATLTPWAKLRGLWDALRPERILRREAPEAGPNDPAVVLFTSGSEGEPKGVVLSHDNLLSNGHQVQARVAIGQEDRILNVLPMFHSFGLTMGTLVPLFAGIRAFCYPSPLEYRVIPELVYTLKSTLLAGTDTFLSGYARMANAGDFSTLRQVFAGAEPLRDHTRHVWMERFGIRILEGYGTTETSPVLAVNTVMAHRTGSVGRPLPGVETILEPVPGVKEGGGLYVRGPNIMLGYLLPNGGTHPEPPKTRHGTGWYDTGDVVSMDESGFIRILGRMKRFAKIGGEMVSLAAVEMLAARSWPDHKHAVASLRDPRKGERLVLVTDHPSPERNHLMEQARELGLGAIHIPGRILPVAQMPVLGTGKIDIKGVQLLAEQA